MTKQKDHHTRKLQYHKIQELKNGRLVEEDVIVKYHISREIASQEELESLEFTQDILCVLYESTVELSNALNYEGKHDVFHYEEGSSELAMSLDCDGIFHEVACRAEEEALNLLLGRFSERQQRRLTLYINGFNYREIAAQEGVSIQAVQGCIARMRKKLKKILKKR